MSMQDGDGSTCAGYWRTGQFSDLLLHLEVNGQPGSTQQLPVHRLLLAQRSQYFKGRLTAADMKDGPACPKPARGKKRTRSGGTAATLSMTEHCATTEEQAAALSVLQHVYTADLPSKDDPEHLAQVCLKADFWGIAPTLQAAFSALSQLAGQPDISAELSAALLSLPHTLPDQLLTTSDGGRALLQHLHKHVATKFNNATQIMRSAELKQQFACLPFLLLQHWASLDSLTTDSENTVVVLLTLWADHNAVRDAAGGRPALPNSQAEELSKCVRLQQLSVFFHLDALPKLWWYEAPPDLPEQHAFFRLGFERLRQRPDSQAFDDMLGWQQARQIQSVVTIEWNLSTAQLQRMWETTDMLNGPTLYHAGYTCRTFARIHQREGLYQLGVYITYEYCPELAPWCTGSVTMTVHVSFDVAAGGDLHWTDEADWVLRDNTDWGFGTSLARGLQPSEKPVLLQYSSLPIKLQLELV